MADILIEKNGPERGYSCEECGSEMHVKAYRVVKNDSLSFVLVCPKCDFEPAKWPEMSVFLGDAV